MTSFSSGVIADADGKYVPVLRFSLSVSEYLKSTGPSSIVAVWVDGRTYDTTGEAEYAKAVILAERDEQWDDREAIIFLYHGVSGFGTLLDTQLHLANHYLLAVGDPYSPDDRYSLHSKTNKDWLPAMPGSSTGEGQEFLLDVPAPQGSTTPTITLGDLKQRIAEVIAELDGGDGSEAYGGCVKEKYRFERVIRYFRDEKGEDAYDKSPTDSVLMSGQAANTLLHRRQNYGIYPDVKKRVWLEGRDAGLFSVAESESTPYGSDGDEVLTAGVDGISYTESFLTVRPLPTGEYKIDRKEVWIRYLLCNYALSHEWTITVTAPEGTLHEAFFDPVTVGTTVAADSANGVLKPAEFPDANGESAVIDRITWEAGTGESGTVKLKLSPRSGISGHTVDFIALDGSVPLSLKVADATVDSANDTLSWTVSSQPWQSGDKLMLRIR